MMTMQPRIDPVTGGEYMPVKACKKCRARWDRSVHQVTEWRGGKPKIYWVCHRCQQRTAPAWIKQEGWYFKESRRTRDSDPLIRAMGNVRVEGEKLQKNLPPDVQFWHDFAHSELYKYTDRMHSLRAVVRHNVRAAVEASKYGSPAIDAARQTLCKALDQDQEESEKCLDWLFGYVLEESRYNANKPENLELNPIASHLGLNRRSVHPRYDAVSNKDKGKTISSCTRSVYKPPLYRLIEEIQLVIEKYDRLVT